MSEEILLPLNEEEAVDPKKLTNPVPSRSSKSNYLISDPHYLGPTPLISGYSSGKSSGQRTLSTTSRESESALENEPERESLNRKKIKRKSAPKSFVYPEYDERDEIGYSTDNSSELPPARLSQISPEKAIVPIEGVAKPRTKRNEGVAMINKEKQHKHRITRYYLHLNALQIDTPIESYTYLDDVYPRKLEEQDMKDAIQKIQTLKEEIEQRQNSLIQQHTIQTNGHEKQTSSTADNQESKMKI